MIKKPTTNKQAGITLLLSMFILSGLILIAVTVSALAIQSIRNSRAVVFSEPAISQAQSGAEEGLWNLKRNAANLPQCDPGNAASGIQQNDSTSSIWSARTYCSSTDQVSVDLSANTPYQFYLYDPDDPNGDLNLDGMINSGYHYIRVTSNSGTRNINVYLTRIDGTPISAQPVALTPGGTIQIGPNPPIRLPSTNDPKVPDNRMILKLVYCESTCATGSDSANVSVTSDVGMPTFPTINSTGCAQRGTGSGGQCTGNEVFNRKIDVSVPR